MDKLYRVDYSLQTIHGIKKTYLPDLFIYEFPILRKTPKGYYIDITSYYRKTGKSNEKWVSNTYNHRFAYPTEKEAIQHFKIRMNIRLFHLNKQLQIAELASKLILNFNP